MPLARLIAPTIKADALEPSGLITGLHYQRLFMWHDLSGTASGSGAVSGRGALKSFQSLLPSAPPPGAFKQFTTGINVCSALE